MKLEKNTQRDMPWSWRHGAMLMAGLVLGMGVEHSLDGRPATALAAPGEGPRPMATSAPAWGQLEHTPFSIELSDEFLPQVTPFLRDPKWFFAGYSPERLMNLFVACDLPGLQLNALLERSSWQAATNGVWVSPPPSAVLNLSQAARQRLYAVLADNELNRSQRFPFRFRPEDFVAWFSTSDLPPEKIALIHRLAYTNDDTVCLADLESLRHTFTTNELRCLFKTLYQTPTLLLHLRVPPHSDVDALVRYWGAGDRARVIKPLLEGLARAHGSQSINVSLLMPAFARTRLYTYPDPATSPAGPQQDCLWTSLNFFNDQPDNHYLQGDYAEQFLRANYEATRRAPGYGDLIALATASGNLVHVCVYIADDVVFTKNGVGGLQPWVLMKLPDMVMKFRSLGSVRQLTYHRKNHSG